MFLNDLTQNEIKIFMKKYVKDMYIALKMCYENCKVDVVIEQRTPSAIYLSTTIGDNTGSLNEKWELTAYKGIRYGNGKSFEIKNLTKDWSRYVYSILDKKNKVKAQEYKNSFLEYIKNEKEQKIVAATETYNELVF
ncbi:MAG: hypothetical protein E7376_03205 [Clostridiales bacterium]|nr:hypothetical protein [Clostridiales bacterium]